VRHNALRPRRPPAGAARCTTAVRRSPRGRSAAPRTPPGHRDPVELPQRAGSLSCASTAAASAPRGDGDVRPREVRGGHSRGPYRRRHRDGTARAPGETAGYPASRAPRCRGITCGAAGNTRHRHSGGRTGRAPMQLVIGISKSCQPGYPVVSARRGHVPTLAPLPRNSLLARSRLTVWPCTSLPSHPRTPRPRLSAQRLARVPSPTLNASRSRAP